MAELEKEIVTQLSAILEEAKSAGVSEDRIRKCLKSTSEVDDIMKKGCRLVNCLVFQIYPLFFLLALFAYPLFKLFLGSPCLITEVTPLGEAMIPVMNCKVCEGVTGALRFVNLSREDFVRHHAYSAKPIVVEGAAVGWSAMDVFSYDYFKNLYLQTPGSLDDDNIKGQFFSYSSNIMDLKDLFQLPAEHAEMKTERWYIGWSTSDPDIGEELQRHIEAPYFIPPGLSHLDLSWIFMGAPGPGASIHIDMVELPSWQAQLSGKKTWTLTPPPECEHVCQPFNVTVNRGDIIVVDTNKWYHQTHIHPGNISITIGSEYH